MIEKLIIKFDHYSHECRHIKKQVRKKTHIKKNLQFWTQQFFDYFVEFGEQNIIISA